MRFVDQPLAVMDDRVDRAGSITTTPMRHDSFTRIEILHYTMGLIKT
jgi:hypothetical protein